MSERLPASLAYLLIYNPTLPTPHSASRDDEDAQEEAHILFYTSRERVVSRDRMLRQVGLAKALVNFSEIFTPGQGCDNVHSQGKRMISVSPEPDFWMHVCVDLAKTQKPNKSKAVKDTDQPPPGGYYYHEESVYDLALRSHLLKGYDSFKLLHGTFSCMMKESEPGTLERHLEHFFTPWAWHWDFENINEFSAHLGLPLHPLSRSLSSLLTSFVDTLPANALPILLSPPYVIDSSLHSVTPYPPSLPRHLLSLTSSPGRSTSNLKPAKRQKSLRGSGPKSHPDVDTNTSKTTLGILSAAGAGMGEVMNVKKWSWPGVLTFGKTGSALRHKSLSGLDPHMSGSQNHSSVQPSGDVSTMGANGDGRMGNSHVIHTIEDHVEGDVDQSALDDAISSPAPREVAVVMETNLGTESEAFHSHKSQPNNVLPPVANSLPENAASTTAPHDADVPPLHTTPSQPRGPAFSTLSVFLSEPSEPLVVRRRQVLHMSLFQLVFALVMDTDCPTDGVDEHLKSLAHTVSGFLEKVREVIDTDSAHSSTDAIVNLGSGPDRSRHIIFSPQHTIFSNALLSATSLLFFESQQTLARDHDMLEIFSRSASPQQWFVARRGLGFNSAGDKIPGTAYLQPNNKEASLVDADNELVGAVRRWAQGAD